MLMLLLWLAVPARAQVAINETNFPDIVSLTAREFITKLRDD